MTRTTVNLAEYMRLIPAPRGGHPKGDTPRIVYAIDCGGLVKLGVSNDPAARLKSMRTIAPFAMDITWAGLGTTSNERRLHAALHKYRYHGEWFLLPVEYPELLTALNNHFNAGGTLDTSRLPWRHLSDEHLAVYDRTLGIRDTK